MGGAVAQVDGADAAGTTGAGVADASDEALALAAGRSDAAAFDALVTRHFDGVHALAWRIAGEGADDLAQDVCERLPRLLRSYRGEARFTTWLHRVVVNASRDTWRRRAAHGRAVEGWAEAEPLRLAEVAETRERLGWLAGAMGSLSGSLRETVALVLGQDMTHAQAAEVLEIGEGTVSWRMSEVRRALKARARGRWRGSGRRELGRQRLGRRGEAMSDEIDALRDALRNPPRPDAAARVRALAAARAAFDAEWAEEGADEGSREGAPENIASASQGSDAGRRRRGERPNGSAAPRRRPMSTLAPTSTPTRRSMRPVWLATASVAAITVAAFVSLDAGILPQLGGERAAVTPERRNVSVERAVETAAPTVPVAPAEIAAEAKVEAEAPPRSAERAVAFDLAPPVAEPAPVEAPAAAQADAAATPAPPASPGLVLDGFAVRREMAAQPSMRDRDAPVVVVPERPSTELHPDVEPGGTLTVADAPVSTFSLDVDTASYSFVRDTLLAGSLPHPDAVRPEEMVNYFTYDLPEPTGEAPFSVSTSVVDTPWNEGTKLLAIGVNGATPRAGEVAPRNVVFLIDTSGSMGDPDKLPLLKRSFRLLLTQLRPEDEVAIVAYAGTAGTVLEPTSAADSAAILDALDALEPGGSTAGRDGLARAYDVAARMTQDGEAARIVLATDGDFNVGPADPDALERYVSGRRQVASLSVLGFGRGNVNDRLMQAIAQNGDGFAAYIDTDAEARRVMVERVAGTLDTIARDVKVQVEFNPTAVSEYRLIGYETRALTRPDFNDDRVDAGEIGAGHQMVALYEIVLAGSGAELVDPLRYGDGTAPAGDAAAPGGTDELAFLRLRYKAPLAPSEGTDDSVLIERPIAPDAADLPPREARFAAAVAAFADHLRGAPRRERLHARRGGGAGGGERRRRPARRARRLPRPRAAGEAGAVGAVR